MASEPKDYNIIFIWMNLTSNTEATDKVQFFNFAYTVKGFQCHSNNNNSLQLLELKGKNNNKTIHVISFLCDIL